MPGEKALLEKISRKVDKLAVKMERSKIEEYVNYLEHPKRLLWSNFLAGLSRGFGIAVGVTILGAVVIYLLEIIVDWNLPVIGKFISEIVRIVQEDLNNRGGLR
ncbi:hypothetical protein CDQ84_04955 [Clostridium thermosuccinogenes]|uniref:Uncharacterized protein n=1 Tax=Clostridium thermosuccinogenes TaxID=84032 RepID=A0A2K2F2V9_9CLOT|nr:DUF5665 domain-containing protein [Pseudoclostridium thermosuccinogenes]AUS96201.1 hypothetical protein CDO33_06970 [Pseudoclostridium thermosuccinogenes]PNT91811.1 hypothetical protein CDQ85_18750 [Pseudoclostridium thermosuccinogenes]PNT93117.1 hypothetical protein CDQ83_06180 [Pseudoclostridium thermosuccinogenes]PNU00779.1 hypothetical protein CDQ84_04955 [Pseudoclostridium thermosuccinogenes]